MYIKLTLKAMTLKMNSVNVKWECLIVKRKDKLLLLFSLSVNCFQNCLHFDLIFFHIITYIILLSFLTNVFLLSVTLFFLYLQRQFFQQLLIYSDETYKSNFYTQNKLSHLYITLTLHISHCSVSYRSWFNIRCTCW